MQDEGTEVAEDVGYLLNHVLVFVVGDTSMNKDEQLFLELISKLDLLIEKIEQLLAIEVARDEKV